MFLSEIHPFCGHDIFYWFTRHRLSKINVDFYRFNRHLISGQFINYSIGQFYFSFNRIHSKPFEHSLYKFYLFYIDCQDIARRFSPTLEDINSLGALSNVPQNAFRIKRSVDAHTLIIVVLHQQNLRKKWCLKQTLCWCAQFFNNCVTSTKCT